MRHAVWLGLLLVRPVALGYSAPGCGRRAWLGTGTGFVVLGGPKNAWSKCKDIESCREEGERRSDEIEKEKGEIVNIGQGVRYRESRRGSGPKLQPGDTAEIMYEVTTSSGNYMWSKGRAKEPGQRDLGETYRVVIGQHDVPIAVERAMLDAGGMQKGSIRRVEMPPALGFETSGWRPGPENFSGRKKQERYQALLTGNGLQPGYNASLLFEVELSKIRQPAK